MFSIIVILHEYGHYKSARIFGIRVEEFGLWIPPRAKELWKNKSWTLFSLNWIPLWWFVKIAGESEIHLEYYSKKWNLLSLWKLEKKLSEKKDIYNASWEEISKTEKKLLKARLEGFHPWENFYEKNIWQKTIVLLAGVIMNFLLAAGIFITLFFIGIQPVWINSVIETDKPSKLIPTLEQSLSEGVLVQEPWIVLYPMEESPSSKAWIQDSDVLTKIDGIAFENITDIQDYIQLKTGEEIRFLVERTTINNESSQKDVVSRLEIPVIVSSEGLIWSYLAPNYQLNEDFEYKYNLPDAIKYGVLETYYQIRLTLSGLSMLLWNIISPETPEEREEALEQVAGPIGIVGVISGALAGWWKLLLILWAIISINLWVFNLLPIPALDGWRILLLWIRSGLEKIFWKKSYFTGVENIIHVLFFVVLIALSVLIAYNDILNISSR